MAARERRTASLDVDLRKVDAARAILGTKSLTDTVDAALDEVIKLRERRRLAQLLFEPGAIQLDDPGAMSGAWR